jgi:hypothetical protein
MGLMGYVVTGLGAVILLSWTTIFFMGKNINSLHEDIGAGEAAITLLIETNMNNYLAVREVEAELRRCSHMRTRAEANAQLATESASKRTKDSYLAADERRDKISEQIELDSSVSGTCGILPRSATELLIEAANSANRNGEGS